MGDENAPVPAPSSRPGAVPLFAVGVLVIFLAGIVDWRLGMLAIFAALLLLPLVLAVIAEAGTLARSSLAISATGGAVTVLMQDPETLAFTSGVATVLALGALRKGRGPLVVVALVVALLLDLVGGYAIAHRLRPRLAASAPGGSAQGNAGGGTLFFVACSKA